MRPPRRFEAPDSTRSCLVGLVPLRFFAAQTLMSVVPAMMRAMPSESSVQVPFVPEVTAAWERIRAWLEEWAPYNLGMARPPAPAEVIKDLVAKFDLDPQLATLLTVVDGELNAGVLLAPSVSLMPASKVRRFELLDGVRDWAGGIPDELNWIEFAVDGCGATLVIEHGDGDDRGAVKVVEYEFGHVGKQVWPSLLVMLEEVADGLETGSPVSGGLGGSDYVPVLGGDGEMWWDSADDATSWSDLSWRQAMERLRRADPEAYATLRPPAPGDALGSLRDGWRRVPSQLADLMRLCDGATGPAAYRVLPSGYRPFTSEEILAGIERLGTPPQMGRPPSPAERAERPKRGPVELDPTFDEHRWDSIPPIPFAVSSAGAELLICRNRRGEDGAVQVEEDGCGTLRTLWPSVAVMVQDIAR